MLTDSYVIGVDFGTDSVRALLVDTYTGKQVCTSVSAYPRWAAGMYSSYSECRFRHNPLDYMECLENVLKDVVARCPDASCIRALAVDTTASTPCLTDSSGTPLSLADSSLAEDPDAMFVLWKDHTGVKEADEITALCSRQEVNYACHSGNTYSAECFWAKVLHILRTNEKVREAAYSSVELGDWITSILTGSCGISERHAGISVIGAKLMWAKEWGGYPPESFFRELDPLLLPIFRHVPRDLYEVGSSAGKISREWAERTGLSADVVIGTGSVDSYAAAVGAGISRGTVVMSAGTSACFMAVMPEEEMAGRIIDGIFVQADDCILPGMTGFETGMSAFGDLFAWYRKLVSWPLKFVEDKDEAQRIGENVLNRLAEEAAALEWTETSPVATDYLNGRRSPFLDMTLTGSATGLRLATSAPELYRSFVEATAFAARTIIRHLRSGGVDVDRIVAVGGIAQKSPFVMQQLADAMEMEIGVSGCSNSACLGAAVTASVAAGLYHGIAQAQEALCPPVELSYKPDSSRKALIDKRYELYKKLTDTTLVRK